MEISPNFVRVMASPLKSGNNSSTITQPFKSGEKLKSTNLFNERMSNLNEKLSKKEGKSELEDTIDRFLGRKINKE